MKSKTLKQFLAEKRKTDAQHPEAIMKALDELANIHPGEYYGSAVIINITDLEGKVWPTRPSTVKRLTRFCLIALRRIARR